MNTSVFSKHRVIISVVAAKNMVSQIWYLKKCAVFIGPPCILGETDGPMQCRYYRTIHIHFNHLCYILQKLQI